MPKNQSNITLFLKRLWRQRNLMFAPRPPEPPPSQDKQQDSDKQDSQSGNGKGSSSSSSGKGSKGNGSETMDKLAKQASDKFKELEKENKANAKRKRQERQAKEKHAKNQSEESKARQEAAKKKAQEQSEKLKKEAEQKRKEAAEKLAKKAMDSLKKSNPKKHNHLNKKLKDKMGTSLSDLAKDIAAKHEDYSGKGAKRKVQHKKHQQAKARPKSKLASSNPKLNKNLAYVEANKELQEAMENLKGYKDQEDIDEDVSYMADNYQVEGLKEETTGQDKDPTSQFDFKTFKQRQGYSINWDKVNSNKDLVYLKKQRLTSKLGIIFSKIAEDLTGFPIEGDDEWNMQELMNRRITKRPLYHCRQSREKESLVLLLDTSPSCDEQAQFFSEIATSALKFKDVEVYSCPNGWIDYRWVYKSKKILKQRVEFKDNHVGSDNLYTKFKNRVIIYFSDYDGWAETKFASQYNKIYFFNCVDSHYYAKVVCASDQAREDFYKGFYGKEFYPCNDDDDFLKLVRKVK